MGDEANNIIDPGHWHGMVPMAAVHRGWLRVGIGQSVANRHVADMWAGLSIGVLLVDMILTPV